MKKSFNKDRAPQTTQIFDLLRSDGYRLTKPRRAVIHTLAQSDGWLRPETIYRRACADAPTLGLVTVYRTLQLLTELGIARRVHTDDGCHGYTLAKHRHGHHLICKQCQQLIEFPGTEDLQPLMAFLENKTGFIIEDHVLELSGLCPECQHSISK
ncbi:MAG: Fur family transcriptional regulator [Anaerolineales bacterium]|jgi:Fe2+ or Zn2+ uptake regulation protein